MKGVGAPASTPQTVYLVPFCLLLQHKPCIQTILLGPLSDMAMTAIWPVAIRNLSYIHAHAPKCEDKSDIISIGLYATYILFQFEPLVFAHLRPLWLVSRLFFDSM